MATGWIGGGACLSTPAEAAQRECSALQGSSSAGPVVCQSADAASAPSVTYLHTVGGVPTYSPGTLAECSYVSAAEMWPIWSSLILFAVVVASWRRVQAIFERESYGS